jgi:uncharacterized membrane protein YhdT
MKLLKQHPILSIANSYLIDSPGPANLSYIWSFGSLLGLCLVIQIITGVSLAMHYIPSGELAFPSVEHVMREIQYGWLIRYLHSNVAAFFFIFVYLHIGKAMYYGSYRTPRVLLWSIGVVIFLIMIVTAFLGYSHSPKWFNINISYLYVLFILFLSIASKVILRKIKDKSKIEHTIKQLKYNKVNNGLYNKVNIRKYSTSCSVNNSIDISDRLKEIIKELGLNPAEWCGKSLVWDQLSNSGETLKLLIPNYSRKTISGWSNDSCMVISQKMKETEMGNRGSKSEFTSNCVKEQRVDGSWHTPMACA